MSSTLNSDFLECDSKEYVDTVNSASVPSALGTAALRLGALNKTCGVNLLARTVILLMERVYNVKEGYNDLYLGSLHPSESQWE